MSRDVQLPVWNALYQVRDFSQYIQAVSARDDNGKSLPVRAVDKTTWHIDGDGAFTVEYEIVADNPGPFGAQINEHHAFFNLAEICVYMLGARNVPIAMRFADFPADWKPASSMEAIIVNCATATCAAQNPLVFVAANYDAMADSPIEIGGFREKWYEDGRAIRYRVVVDADPSDYDMTAVANMAHKIAVTETEWMRDQPTFPFGYTFIYHFPRHPAGGGMEHAYSTAIDASADRVRANPFSLASVTAHEFFHLWNVKRIRPQSLEPVDYTKEQYTRALWFSEGVTSTVADYIRVRAGYLDEKGFLAELADNIRRLESRPARLTQSVEESSLDAWLEKYQDYDQPERSISYYNKGEIVGMLLDLRLREVSGGKISLRDLFRWMNEHFAKQGKFFPDSAGVEEAAEKLTGADFRDFFAKYVAGVDAIPYNAFFASVGLRLDQRTIYVADAGFRVSRRYGPLVVTAVDPNSGAAKAGVQAGDVVEEFNGRPVLRSLEAAVESLNPGESVRMKVAGPAGQREFKFKLGSKAAEDYAFVETGDATSAQRARRAAWIRGDSE